jgi:RNA polymerase sigma-70 factor (ECF subfamily)
MPPAPSVAPEQETRAPTLIHQQGPGISLSRWERHNARMAEQSRLPLASLFRDVRPGPVDEALDRVLGTAWATARAAHPEISLPVERFIWRLAKSMDCANESVSSEDDVVALGKLHHADLWLACGCADNEPRAIAKLESKLAEMPQMLGRQRPKPAEIDEVLQLLRVGLLVGERPAIADYSGRGAIGSWLRVAALRKLSNLRRSSDVEQRAKRDAETMLARADPELAYLKSNYSGEFERALRDAFRALSTEHRNLLRLRLVDGLGVAQIGELHGVHRGTITRWIEEARRCVIEESARLLRERLNVGSSEMDSLFGLVRSQLDISLRILVRDGVPEG